MLNSIRPVPDREFKENLLQRLQTVEVELNAVASRGGQWRLPLKFGLASLAIVLLLSGGVLAKPALAGTLVEAARVCGFNLTCAACASPMHGFSWRVQLSSAVL